MAIECGKGHLYDPELYATCPYCNAGTQSVNFAQSPVTAGSKTMPVSGGYNAVPTVNDGRTLPPQGYRPAPAPAPAPAPEKSVASENRTVGIMKEKLGFDPVVAWLVCIKGDNIGMDYKLRGQINTIGRGKKNDVCIPGDNTISEDSHARLSYSPKTGRFNLIPDANKNIIYLNDQEVFTVAELKAYDAIELGSTKLMFVPLCSETFNWDDLKKGE